MKAGMTPGSRAALLAITILLAGCAPPPERTADSIYVGGSIVTVNDKQPTAEALAVKDGHILAVGKRTGIERAHKGPKTRIVDLAGHALLPSFIDAHSHYFSSLVVASQVKPGAPPAGLGGDSASVLAALLNVRSIFGSLPKPNTEQEVEWSRAGQMLYAQAGITTAHEGATHADELEVMKRAAEADANIIDIVAYPVITELDSILESNPVADWGQYRKRLKIGGVNITLDGSPQGRTAYFTTPYLRGGPGDEKDWRGELMFPESTVRKMVKQVYELGVPLNLHANGDAAIDVFLRAHELASGHNRGADHRVTLIHGQFASRDQLEKFRAYHITPSFYTLHTYYFAEAHLANRGAEQAAFMSPMRAAVALGLNPTNHTDFVVAPLDQMFMMWSAVNRLSRSGDVIGPDQRLAPLDALKAMTINAAMQYGEQDQKGSLEPKKLADMVILDRNPLEGDPVAIKDIGVLETIKEGKTIYKRP